MDEKRNLYQLIVNRESEKLSTEFNKRLVKLEEDFHSKGAASVGAYWRKVLEERLKYLVEISKLQAEKYKEIVLDGKIDSNEKINDIIDQLGVGSENSEARKFIQDGFKESLMGLRDKGGNENFISYLTTEFNRGIDKMVSDIRNNLNIEFLENERENDLENNPKYAGSEKIEIKGKVIKKINELSRSYTNYFRKLPKIPGIIIKSILIILLIIIFILSNKLLDFLSSLLWDFIKGLF